MDSKTRRLALTVDLAPTVLDLVGLPISPSIQGRSLLPLLRGAPASWRKAVLVEFYTNEQPLPYLLDMDYKAIRTGRYKYIHWIKFPGQDELYDLQADPLERRNLATDPAMCTVRASLRADLGKLVLEAVGLPNP